MKLAPTILVLDDELPQIVTLRACLGELGTVAPFHEPVTALMFVQEHTVDVAIVDVHLPRMAMSGLEFMGKVRDFDQDIQFILRTGDASGEVADEAIGLKAFRRVIKGKTSVKELREYTQAAIAETRAMRQKSLRASNSAVVSKHLEQTLGVIEDELSVAESYKGIIHAMRNHLTALSSTAEYWAAAAGEPQNEGQRTVAEKNRALVSRMLSEMNAFLDGPFAEVHSTKTVHSQADVNATLLAIKKNFLAPSIWSADFKTVSINLLPAALRVEASSIKLLTALRHVVEYCLQMALVKTTVFVNAAHTPNLDHAIDAIPYEKLVFNRPVRNHVAGYVCFTFQTGPVQMTLEEIRKQFHQYPDDPRIGNIHMVGLSLGEDNSATVAHIDREGLLFINLLVRVQS